MTSHSPERGAFVRRMSTVSPIRAEIMRMLEEVEASTADLVRNGAPVFCADTTDALTHAALDRLASMEEQGVDANDILRAVEIAFATALGSTLCLLAQTHRMDAGVLAISYGLNIRCRTIRYVNNVMGPRR